MFIKHYFLPFLLIAAYIVFSSNIGGTSIYMYDEVKNAQCAKEMLENGNMIVPTFNHELRTDKPPLHYYFMIGAYKVFGFGPFAARFFSVIFGVLTIFATFLFTKRFLGFEIASISVLVLISSIQFATQFHLATPDPFLIGLITLALFCFYNAFKETKKKWYYLAYLFIGLATLAKGPVAILLPGIIVLLFLIFEKKCSLENIMALRPLEGIAIILLISSPWYMLVHIETNGAWSEGFFLKHNLQRYTNEMEGHGAPFFMPLVYVITGLLPFGFFLPQALVKGFKERKKDSFIHFCLVVIAVYTGFFAFSETILPSYPAPCLPFGATLLAYYLVRQKEKFSNLSIEILIGVTLIAFFGLALPVGVFLGLQTESYLQDTAFISIYLIVFPFFIIVGLFYLYKREIRHSLLITSIGFWLGILLIHFFAYPVIDKINPVSLLENIPENSEVIAYKQMNPAFVIPLNAPVVQLENIQDLKLYLQEKEEVYIISRKKYQKELFENIQDLKFIAYKKELFEKPFAMLIKHTKLK